MLKKYWPAYVVIWNIHKFYFVVHEVKKINKKKTLSYAARRKGNFKIVLDKNRIVSLVVCERVVAWMKKKLNLLRIKFEKVVK